MIKWLKNKINKYMYDIDALAQTRDFIMGKDYQWVNTPDNNKMSTITKVVDVFSRGGLMAVKLADGSSVSLEELNTKLMAIMDGQEALTKAECMSIRGPIIDPTITNPESLPKVGQPVQAEVQATVKSAGIFEMFATEESLLNLNLRFCDNMRCIQNGKEPIVFHTKICKLFGTTRTLSSLFTITGSPS
jgi:hypothetical protein